MTWYVKHEQSFYGPFDGYHKAKDKGDEIALESGEEVELLEMQESYRLY